MLTVPSRIGRTAALAGALCAVAASSASAQVPDAESAPASSRRAESAATPPTMAETAARREARANRAWRAGNPPTIIEVTSAGEGGFDLTSAGIGAAIPLTLILIEVGGRWVVRRRRDPARARLA